MFQPSGNGAQGAETLHPVLYGFDVRAEQAPPWKAAL